MYGLNILARSSRVLSLRRWGVHPPDRLPDRLQRSWTGRGQERNAELTTVPDRRPRPELVAEEVKRLDRIVSPPFCILAVDELCLLRMQHQPAGREAGLQSLVPSPLRRF